MVRRMKPQTVRKGSPLGRWAEAPKLIPLEKKPEAQPGYSQLLKGTIAAHSWLHSVAYAVGWVLEWMVLPVAVLLVLPVVLFALSVWLLPQRAASFGAARKSFKLWCGEGDLNPHEIAPASTSS